MYANLDYLKITLPSDPDWQLSTYKKLVEKQRDMSKQESTIDGPVSVASSLKVGYLFETAFHKPSKKTDGLLDREYLSELENELVADEFDRSTELWTNREVVLAAKVLSSKTPKRHGIKFASDNQMRRVYDIIFEVFRYRTIINEILHNIDFENIYQNPRKLDENETISFKALKLLEIADILKDIKIQLAASFSKFKIKHCALSLSDMLPRHLRNERFKKSSETIISCWINTFLTSPEYVVNVLKKAGLSQMKNFEDLVSETFKMDHLLPYFIHIYPKEKSEFLNKMPLFQKYLLILQVFQYPLPWSTI
ncbi:putative methyltransferase NSUN7 [Sipha flava]|uniref:Methyltransferase NSUN7 n=1 Tax=Sipha flava TaxID=143950 RepID=A0A8B8FJN9_9HEMI|nr:putative methyltransferase NSUN7 [Sipha flava]